MPQLTPQFLFDLESKMRIISENSYNALLQNQWWQTVAKETPTQSKKERLIWLLDTAKIERPNGANQAIFEDMVSQTTEFEVEPATAGLELDRDQMEDLDGNGVTLAGEWARGMGAYAAYWPQKQVAAAIKANPTTYDALSFFNGSHLVNPFRPELGTYSNIHTAGSGAGAVPIDASVTVEVALANLQKVIANLATIPLANGEDPRGLRVSRLIVPPALFARAVQLTDAKFIAQAATGGAGSGDVAATIAAMGLGFPTQADELAAAFGGSDTDYYIATTEITGNNLGAFTYVNRSPFQMMMHGPMTSADLMRIERLQWKTRGRNTVGAGHPFLLHKCRAA